MTISLGTIQLLREAGFREEQLVNAHEIEIAGNPAVELSYGPSLRDKATVGQRDGQA